MSEVKVFVYGTLKVGGYFAKRFDGVRLSSVKATVSGKLYGGKDYPRLLLAPEEEACLVYGELHTYFKADEVIKAMDSIEGYREDQSKVYNLYNRKLIKVKLEDGTEEEAFIYEYAHKPEFDADVLESGKWEI